MMRRNGAVRRGGVKKPFGLVNRSDITSPPATLTLRPSHPQDLKWRSSVCGPACGPHQVSSRKPSRARGRARRGKRPQSTGRLGDDGLPLAPLLLCCRVSTARRDTRRRMLQTHKGTVSCACTRGVSRRKGRSDFSKNSSTVSDSSSDSFFNGL